MTYDRISDSFPKVGGLRHKKVVIKFGGNSLSDEGDLSRFSKDIAQLVSLGLRPVIVHGGGPEITKEMDDRGMKARKVNGLRITDDATLQVAMEVLASINAQIVQALRATNIRSMGMPGSDGKTIVCRRKPPMRVESENDTFTEVDLGNVGDVIRVNPAQIDRLCASGFVPVIYPICADQSGNLMNVNADTAAAHLATALRSEEMVLVTDVPGIMEDQQHQESLINEISFNGVDELIKAGIVTGGMVPKVEACKIALRKGVKAAHMVHGKEPQVLINSLLKGAQTGTRITRGDGVDFQ